MHSSTDDVERTFSELGTFIVVAIVMMVLVAWMRDIDGIASSIQEASGIYPMHMNAALCLMSAGCGGCVGSMVFALLGWVAQLIDPSGWDRGDRR